VDGCVHHPFLDFQFGGLEVDLGAITTGVIAAFLQQLTSCNSLPYRA
jgi:hypothetical protein